MNFITGGGLLQTMDLTISCSMLFRPGTGRGNRMDSPPTLLERLRQHRAAMTSRERQIAAYLEAGYPHAGLESATAVGERVNVSAATVVRFVAKLGYAGYAELQRELRDQVETRLTSPLQRLIGPREAAHQATAMAAEHLPPIPADAIDIVTRTFETAMASVTRTYGALDRRMLDAIVSRLLNCTGSIWIVGEKKGRSLALYLYAQLNLCLRRVHLLNTDASFGPDRLLDVGDGDIVVVFDVRRYVESTLHAAEWCQSRGATLVVLCDSPSSPLYDRSRLRMAAVTHTAGAFDSYVGLMLIADMVTNAITAADPERARERLEAAEAAIARFRIFGPPEGTPP